MTLSEDTGMQQHWLDLDLKSLYIQSIVKKHLKATGLLQQWGIGNLVLWSNKERTSENQSQSEYSKNVHDKYVLCSQ